MSKKFSTLLTNSLLAFGTLLTLFPSIALLADILRGDFFGTIDSGGGGDLQ